ncbi:MAG: HEAT repeat domain-containing protein, partial [Planctomycetota bacterium]|nr:HEAT repeat domain-containing protein [Planctomycetota bacterium]
LLAVGLASRAEEEKEKDDVPRANSQVVGFCNNQASFTAMFEELDPLVVKLAEAKTDEDRQKLEDQIATDYGEKGIECLIRYREPKLIPLFSRLASHEQWYVRRLAVWALERNGAISEIEKVAVMLDDENRLVRETAALCLCALYTRAEKYGKEIPQTPENSKIAKKLGSIKQRHVAALKEKVGKEETAYVKAAFEAALFGMTKKPPERIHEEQLNGKVAPRRIPHGETGALQKFITDKYTKEGGGKCGPSKTWGYPVSVYPKEILTGLISDKPLITLTAKANSLHFGHDCGWYCEGAGVYAIGDGVVRMVKQGADWGGLVVVEHQCEDKTYVNALYGHCGMWVFAPAGTVVKKGQLLAVMGLSFSPENGGHGAHSHFGMFQGKFQATMCFGRGGAGSSTKGWLIPAEFLGPKVEGKEIDPESY